VYGSRPFVNLLLCLAHVYILKVFQGVARFAWYVIHLAIILGLVTLDRCMGVFWNLGIFTCLC
jgi:hypothetical protein